MEKLKNRKRTLLTKYRTIVEGGIYHIIQRAPGKELLFLEDNDNLYFLSILKETAKTFKIEVFCFALLSNHLHLLLKIKDKNLAEAMKFLFQSYALYFNKKYERKGHVFYGRYRASFCDNSNYLLTLSLYIHLNPFKAGLTKNLFAYKWFSLNPYIKSTKPTFLNTLVILSLLSDNNEKAKKSYKNILENANSIEYIDTLKSPKAMSSFFKSFLRLAHQHKLPVHRENLKDSFLWEEMEKKIEKMKMKKRITKPSERKALAYLIRQLLSSGYNLTEISQKLGLHRTTIYRLQQ